MFGLSVCFSLTCHKHDRYRDLAVPGSQAECRRVRVHRGRAVGNKASCRHQGTAWKGPIPVLPEWLQGVRPGHMRPPVLTAVSGEPGPGEDRTEDGLRQVQAH